MDITEFRVIRPPVIDNSGELRLPDEVPDLRHGGNLTMIPPPITLSTIPEELGSGNDDPLQELPLAQRNPLQRTYYVIDRMNGFLRRHNDSLTGGDVAKQLTMLRESANLSTAGINWQFNLLIAQMCLTYWIVQGLAGTEASGHVRAMTLTRLALVSDLLLLAFDALEALDKADVIAALNQRTVTLPAGFSEKVIKKAKIQLIREATVSDMHVIRREWACYILGEVANVRNLMSGEKFVLTQTQMREQETIVTTDTERQERTEQEDSSKLASELSQEITTQLSLAVNGYVDASVQYKAPVATINVAGGASVGLSMQRGEQFARKVAREAVTRAVRTVDSRTRETRSERELTRSEDVTRYELSNTGEGVSAVYRWVDRVDRYQVFRYPDRLQLEFQLPEPAEFYRKRTGTAAKASADKDRPPEEFKLALADITEARLAELAGDYRASNLPSIPDEYISLSRTVVLELPKESLPAGDKTEYNSPTQSKDLEIPIPSSYSAQSVTYSGHGYPIWSKWGIGSSTVVAVIDGFHSGFATVAIGDKTRVHWVGGYRKPGTDLEFLASYGDNTDKGSVETVQWTDQASQNIVRSVPFGRAMLVIGRDSDSDLQPEPDTEVALAPGVSLSLRVGVSTVGLAGSVVSFLVKCKRTDEALLAWKMSVYDALFSAWTQWKREYDAAQLRQSLVGSTAGDAGSSLRNEQIIREELKRQVISWLLNEEEFSGRPALRADDNDADFKSISFEKSRESAPVIQFLEQAFEWGNMMYAFYPYYWAAGTKWISLASLTANDAEFERFLRAGSSRVVVPVRLAFTDAVKNWLTYQKPFLTGQLPGPDHELFVAIDREIRDLTASWEGGIAEDSWEARVSTTLLYLNEQTEFPIKNDAAVLPVPENEVFVARPLCT